MLSGYLRKKGVDLITSCEPGGTPLGRHLRAAFLETEETVSPLAELLLFAADRAQHVEFLIKPAIAAGRIVISDRYADATVAYQGAGRGFDAETIAQVVRLATGGLKPGLTIFFDIAVETAIQRMQTRGESGTKANRMDGETVEFYSRVRDAYLNTAAAEPERVHVIDASGSVEEIHKDVIAAVDKILK